jgi:hypothetical protein
VIDRLIRLTTALAVLMVASIAAVISYPHAYEFVATHGESGLTARLLPFTVDDLDLGIVHGGARREPPEPLGVTPGAVGPRCRGIIATVGANLAHGPVGAVVSAWPALVLVGSFEFLMLLTRKTPSGRRRPGCRRRAE